MGGIKFAQTLWQGAMSDRGLVAARLGAGLVQGALLYWLYRAERFHEWPSTTPILFEPLVLMGLFLPLLFISGIGNLRIRILLLWIAAATFTLIGLGAHDAWRSAGSGSRYDNDPSLPLLVFTAAALFIAHALVTAGDADKRLIAGYGRYFDAAWKHIIQVALAIGFVAAFWILYSLASGLFDLIGIHLLNRLRERAWFVIPVSAMGTAFALHMTDVHVQIVRGLRNLALTLLSWLLVMMTALLLAFVLALPFTGLAPLWDQQSATALLLGGAASLVILINATYQDGAADPATPAFMRYAALAAAFTLLPLAGLAAYGLALRIGPYGFTPDRVIALACVSVALTYALGYGASLRHPKRWLATLPRTNLAVSGLIIALVLALFTPLADPARISVADQLSRLKDGKIAADTFDYNFLRFHSDRYGRQALAKLAGTTEGPNAAIVSARAKEALSRDYAWTRPNPPTKFELAELIAVYPAGKALPDSFLAQDWSTPAQTLPNLSCIASRTSKCEAILADLDSDGMDEILLKDADTPYTSALKRTAEGRWTQIATLYVPDCGPVKNALRDGKFKPVPPKLADLDIDGRRVHVEARNDACD